MELNFFRKKTLFPYGALIFLNLLAHFLPFERIAPTVDEYQRLAMLYTMPLKDVYQYIFHTPDRLLGNLYFFTLEWLINRHQLISLVLLFVVHSIFILFVYRLMVVLLSNKLLAFLASVIHLLLPNKLEPFHGFDYTWPTLALVFGLGSFLSFIYFIKKEKNGFFFLSLFLYAIAIFWFEVPFFLPLVLACYAGFYSRKKIKSMMGTLLFWIPALFYALIQVFGHYLFGLDQTTRPVQDMAMIWHNITVCIPRIYVGHDMLQAICYGLYRFFTIELKWFFIILILDIIVCYKFIKWLNALSESDLVVKDLKLIFLSLVMFVAFLIPTSLWVVSGRYTTLSSMGVVIICLFGLRFSLIQKYKTGMITGIFLLFLIACQGTAWTQVVSRRIVYAVEQYCIKNKDQILSASRIVIDQYSFSKNIPSGWFKKEEDVLDTFWGEPGLQYVTFPDMVQVAMGENRRIFIRGEQSYYNALDGKKPIFVVRSPRDMNTEKGQLKFKIRDNVDITIPELGTMIIDYDKVFGKK